MHAGKVELANKCNVRPAIWRPHARLALTYLTMNGSHYQDFIRNYEMSVIVVGHNINVYKKYKRGDLINMNH